MTARSGPMLGGVDVRYRPDTVDRDPGRGRRQRCPGGERRRPPVRPARPWPGRSRPSITTAVSTCWLMPASARPASGSASRTPPRTAPRRSASTPAPRFGETISLTGERLARGLSRQRRAPDRRPRAARISRRAASRPAPASRSPTTGWPTAAPPARRSCSSAPPSACSTTGSSWTRRPRLPLGGHSDSIDFPARHRLSARFALTPSVALIGGYEIADGDTIDARTARIGFDIAPWAGARIALSGNFQDISRIWPAQLRCLRPVAVAGALRALVGRFHPRRQPDARRGRSGKGAEPAPSGGERRLHRRRYLAHRKFHRRDRGRDVSRGPLEPDRPRRISRRRARGSLRRHPCRAPPDRRGPCGGRRAQLVHCGGGWRRPDAHCERTTDLGPPAAEQRILLSRQIRVARGHGAGRSRGPVRAPRPRRSRSPATRGPGA